MSRNRLHAETSPYLLQHKDNPVHWFPWGAEAFAEARRLDRPVLLSVGYSACHWCHVMAHESFEDRRTAELMNDLFVNIKVDREERPDVDALYMAALHRIGDQGGWPLTMFLTPDAEPFWGGTYFPKTARYGRPAFSDLLREVARVYRDDREKALNNASALTEAVTPTPEKAKGGDIDLGGVSALAGRIGELFDPIHGGLNGTPKFPNAAVMSFMWKAGIRFGLEPCLKAVETTLENICQGGIYDHLGGGMARYSVDKRWLVPHFEKMLYDNALFVEALTEAWKETGRRLFERRAAETVEWMLREMTVDGGGLASSLDADSDGEEGKFYVWTLEEVRRVLGDVDAAFFARTYDVTSEGNWEGVNILNRLGSMADLSDEDEARLTGLRGRLLGERDLRQRPGWDDKVLADWNGLAISALARAGEAFGRQDWIKAADTIYKFIKDHLGEEGRLRHSFRAGRGGAMAVASDYANMIAGALALYQVTGDEDKLRDARTWEETLERYYWSEGLGGYCFTSDDAPDIIVRTISAQDDSTPNANATMLASLTAFHMITGEERFRERAEALWEGQRRRALASAVAHTGFISAAVDMKAPLYIASAGGGETADRLWRTLGRVSIPGAVTQRLVEGRDAAPGSPAYGKSKIDGKPTVYVCAGPQCSPPVTDPVGLRETVLRSRRINAEA